MELWGLRAAATGVIVGASTAVAFFWLASSTRSGQASCSRRILTTNLTPAGGRGGESRDSSGARDGEGRKPNKAAAEAPRRLTEYRIPGVENAGGGKPGYSAARMSIAAGATLGPYAIVGQIGAGGMGEVYKAKDTRLNRTVAVKVLPAHFSQDAEMKQRFEREAQTVAGLNHPNICVLYDVGRERPAPDAEPVDFIVMEFLDGQSLANRLGGGAIPLDEALEVGAQVADALE